MEPNLQSIFITNAMGVALILMLYITSYLTRERRHTSDRLFTFMIFACAFACVCECSTWFADGHTNPLARFANWFGNTYCYLCTSCYLYLWVLYVDLRLHKGEERIRHWHPGLLVPICISVVAILTNPFTHFMFTIDDANVYKREIGNYSSYIVMIASIGYSIYLKASYQRKYGKVRFFPIWAFVLPALAGGIIQACFFGISIGWPCVCLALTSIHMSQQNELAYVDSLTNLYNRAFLDSALKNMHRRGTVGGIMVDLDFFKAINDTYGHSAGDNALQEVAGILVKSAPEEALVTRMAGDEFMILLQDPAEDELVAIENAIDAEIEKRNASSDKPFTLSLSYGHCIMNANLNTIDDFLRCMDQNMYATKAHHHEQQSMQTE